MEPLPRDFYSRDTVTVARALLGKVLVRWTDHGDIAAKIVEVEAYKGSDDPASHAYRGKTSRNQLMFGEAGFTYIYFIYGNHYCLNVTTETEGIPGAVLIRAVEIMRGQEIASRHRHVKASKDLTNGPGKLTQALNITQAQNGLDVTRLQELYIGDPENTERFNTVVATRVGIKVGREKPWRFYIEDNEFVSRSETR
jgi:DNA-3-methyladenine glycosylase